jgi:hypothetical protein
MAERQYLDRDVDLDLARMRGVRADDVERRRQYQSARLEMEFGQPHHFEPPTFRGVDLLHCFVEGLALGSDRE